MKIINTLSTTMKSQFIKKHPISNFLQGISMKYFKDILQTMILNAHPSKT